MQKWQWKQGGDILELLRTIIQNIIINENQFSGNNVYIDYYYRGIMSYYRISKYLFVD
jgi:hypothetical protein